MDSDFMNNMANMLKNGDFSDDIKSKMNQFFNQNTTSSSNTNSNDASNDTASHSNSINPEMLQNMIKMFMNQSNSSNSSDAHTASSKEDNSPNFDINMLLKMKSIMDKMQGSKNDPRSNLLLSLKPYLKESRKSKLDQYVQLLNMTKVMEAFSENGGEKIK